MKALLGLVLLAGVQFPVVAHSGIQYESAWECRDTPRWNWYCDPPQAVPVPPTKPNERKPSKAIPDITKAKDLAEARKILEMLQERAIWDATTANTREYLKAQSFLLSKSTLFADVYRRAVWQEPGMFESPGMRPAANTMAANIYDRDREQRKKISMASLAKSAGLYFFFRSDCPYCHRQAEILHRMKSDFGFEVMGISLDGKPIPGFPQFQTDRGAAQRWGVTTVPSVFLVTPGATEPVMITQGLTALTDIINHIYVLTQTKPGEEM